jgi:uncharacterized protein YdeI (YjbR/CyaY-like superfamily)
MQTHNGVEAYYPKTRKQWRNWLMKNGQSKSSVWVVLQYKKSTQRGISYDDAVEEALCFGWIDSKGNKRDDETWYLYLTPRKASSSWSKPNRKRALKMIKEGLMTEIGQKLIDLAKKEGRWAKEE